MTPLQPLTGGPSEASQDLNALTPSTIAVHDHIGHTWYGEILDRDATIHAFTQHIIDRIHVRWPNANVTVTIDDNVDASPSVHVAGTTSSDAIKVRHAVEHYLAVMMTSPDFLVWAEES